VRIAAVGIETIHRSRRVPRSYEIREWRWLGPMKGWTAFDDVRKRWRRSTDGVEARVAERGITLTFTSGAQVVLLEEEATWLRDELLRGEFKSPKRDAGIVVDRALTAHQGNAELPPADMTPANVVELTWALRGMLERDSDRFIGSPLLMHLRDLLFIELEREREV
jgi:hypothetical protein